MNYVVREIWHWVISESNWLSATHVPVILNAEAEKESKQQELRTKQMLNRHGFKFAVEKLRFVPTADLFVSRSNTQVEKFMSQRSDPKGIAVHSFKKLWVGLELYAFPSFICIPKVMQKKWKDRFVRILLTLDWPNQIWYSQLSQLIIKDVVLPPRSNLPVQERQKNIHSTKHCT